MSFHKLAIIGYGKIAQDQHIPAIAAAAGIELAAVVSGHAKSVPGVDKVFGSASDLYRDLPEVDCVAVCSAPDQRYATAREALLAGKHVLLEKPPATSLGEARALLDLAEANDLTLYATWHARANPAVREAARRLQGQEVRTLKVTWKEDVRRWHPGQAWVWAPGGFGVFDPGINALSIVTAILPGRVFVQQAKLSVASNRQQPIAASLSFGSEPPADSLTAEFDWRQEGEQIWDIEVVTRAGATLLLSQGGAKLAVDGANVATPGSGEYPELYARFVDLLDRGARDVDLRPFELVADAFLCAERGDVDTFNE